MAWRPASPSQSVEVWKQLALSHTTASQLITIIRTQGVQHYQWRAVDQDGIVRDIVVQRRRSAKAAKCFFRLLLQGPQYVPRVTFLAARHPKLLVRGSTQPGP